MVFQELFVVLVVFLVLAFSKDVRYSIEAHYRSGAPDGVEVNHILGVNGDFPGPKIEATIGDTLYVTVTNNIQRHHLHAPDQRLTVHWHGLFQNGTPFEDGPEMISQCPFPPGHTQTYVFELKQAGTYWYHSHYGYQYTEGMWGSLIIHNKPEVYADDYDAELLIILSDWYHTSGQINSDWFLSPASAGNEPIPSSVLMNGVGQYPCNATKRPCKQVRPPVFPVQRGKRYRVRVINTSAMTSFFFSIENHTLTVIEVDGVDTVKVTFDRVPIAAAQRYSFIVEMSGTKHEYNILAEADLSMFNFDDPNINPSPENLTPLVKGKLIYLPSLPWNPLNIFKSPRPQPGPNLPVHSGAGAGFPGSMLLQPHDKILAPSHFDQEIVLDVEGITDDEGVDHLTFNNITYVVGDTPLLGLVMRNKTIPESANSYTTGHLQVVQIVLNNHDTGPHPFHLHGHTFFVLGFGGEDDGDYDPDTDKLVLDGIRRDTVVVNTGSWIVLRFITDNPGVWYFHCHINWHLESGLAITIIESPDLIRSRFTIPQQTQRICRTIGVEI